jgi:predicted membrane-bound mannosyltransferase
LQKEQNVGLEYVKALAPTVGNLVSGLGVAVINAGVQKNASDNNRAILLGDQAADRGIVEAVAEVGIAAAETSGLFVSGDNYALSDSASISQDQASTVAETTTTTETTTSSEITDSYNTENADSYNDQSDNTDNSYVTYGDKQMTLESLLAFLSESGEPYSFTVGEETYTDTTEEEENAGLNCVPTFDGFVCTGE